MPVYILDRLKRKDIPLLLHDQVLIDSFKQNSFVIASFQSSSRVQPFQHFRRYLKTDHLHCHGAMIRDRLLL